MSNLPVYFIRHNWQPEKNRQKIIDDLFKNKEIAIHFENKGIDVNSYTYRAARTALTILKKASTSDCIIVAAYMKKDEIILGKPSKTRDITLKNVKSDDNKDQIELKIIQLEECFEIEPEEMPLLSILQPPYATMVQWRKAEIAINSYFEYLVSGKKGSKPVSLRFMSGWHCEILCEEWLRLNKVLKYKLFHTGKFMKNLDIVGKAFDGKLVLSQVKFESTESQFKDFCAHCSSSLSSGNYIYYFTSRESISNFKSKTPQGINLISLDDVYQYIYADDSDFIESLIYG